MGTGMVGWAVRWAVADVGRTEAWVLALGVCWALWLWRSAQTELAGKVQRRALRRERREARLLRAHLRVLPAPVSGRAGEEEELGLGVELVDGVEGVWEGLVRNEGRRELWLLLAGPWEEAEVLPEGLVHLPPAASLPVSVRGHFFALNIPPLGRRTRPDVFRFLVFPSATPSRDYVVEPVALPLALTLHSASQGPSWPRPSRQALLRLLRRHRFAPQPWLEDRRAGPLPADELPDGLPSPGSSLSSLSSRPSLPRLDPDTLSTQAPTPVSLTH